MIFPQERNISAIRANTMSLIDKIRVQTRRSFHMIEAYVFLRTHRDLVTAGQHAGQLLAIFSVVATRTMEAPLLDTLTVTVAFDTASLCLIKYRMVSPANTLVYQSFDNVGK